MALPSEGHKIPLSKQVKIKNFIGGGGEIRTLETLPFTHFPGVLLQPLGHSTVLKGRYSKLAPHALQVLYIAR